MTKWFKKNFKTRIVLLTFTTVIASGLAIGTGLLWHFDRVSQKTLNNRVQIEADIINQNLATSVLFDDAETAREILSTFSADPAILSVTLTTADGATLAHYEQSHDTIDDNRTFLVTTPLEFEGRIIGTLKTTVSDQEVVDQSLTNIGFVAITLAVIYLLVAAVIRPVMRSLLVPLYNLHDLSQRIAETRNYGLRVNIVSDDEVGALSKMFNYMVAQIEHRDDRLEKQVQQRTAELEQLAEEFRYRAFHDSLTGLPNRAYLNDHFERNVQHADRYRVRLACLLLDLDDFKAINDTKGHEFGDQLIIEVARSLKSATRGEDVVCRLGGDEFIVMMNDLKDVQCIESIASKILATLNNDFTVNGEQVRTAASIGGAIYPDHGDTLSTIKRNADVAMYRAKDAGKNRFCLFSEGMQEEVRQRLMIQSSLRPALDSGQFQVFLQPQIDAQHNTLVGCEALVRWIHPEEGFLTPDRFIPIAEQIGLIANIDFFVVDQCCQLLHRWAHHGHQPLCIAFNLSGRHFQSYHVVDELQRIITDNAVDPAQLELEITEAVLIQDPDKAHDIIRALRDLGISISLDDFGTGYSSLNYLRTLPIDTVKLDRSFVSNIDSSEQDRRLIHGIVSLAKDLELDLVAEGVETESQLQALVELGCVTMQGYYFLRPVPVEDFNRWRRDNGYTQTLTQQRSSTSQG